MRRVSLPLLVTAGCLLVCAGSVRAQEEAGKELEAQYTQIVQDLQKGQTDTLNKAAHTDFKYVALLGKEGGKEQWAADFKQFLSLFKSPDVKITLISSTIKGDEATEIFMQKVTGDGTLPDGRAGALDFERTERTVWAKAEGGWKLKAVKHVMNEGRFEKRQIPFRSPQGEEDIRQSIQQFYDAVSDVYIKQDLAAIEKGLSDEFPVFDASGEKLSKKEFLDRMKAGAKLLTNPIILMSIQAMGHDGDMLKVIRRGTILAEVKLPGGKSGPLRYINITRDTWAKPEKNWVMRRSEELNADAFLDGKRIPLALISGR